MMYRVALALTLASCGGPDQPVAAPAGDATPGQRDAGAPPDAALPAPECPCTWQGACLTLGGPCGASGLLCVLEATGYECGAPTPINTKVWPSPEERACAEAGACWAGGACYDPGTWCGATGLVCLLGTPGTAPGACSDRCGTRHGAPCCNGWCPPGLECRMSGGEVTSTACEPG